MLVWRRPEDWLEILSVIDHYLLHCIWRWRGWAQTVDKMLFLAGIGRVGCAYIYLIPYFSSANNFITLKNTINSFILFNRLLLIGYIKLLESLFLSNNQPWNPH